MNSRMAAPMVCALVAGCSATFAAEPVAEAKLQPLGASHVSGTVVFTQKGGAVEVVASVTGLSPGGHGFHIHEKGDCSAPDGTSAGGHFNPTGMPHGDPAHGEHHSGDMPMLVADDNGNAKLAATLKTLALDGPNAVAGRSVIVHAGADDFKTQPTGNSGARVACGVITKK